MRERLKRTQGGLKGEIKEEIKDLINSEVKNRRWKKLKKNKRSFEEIFEQHMEHTENTQKRCNKVTKKKKLIQRTDFFFEKRILLIARPCKEDIKGNRSGKSSGKVQRGWLGLQNREQ